MTRLRVTLAAIARASGLFATIGAARVTFTERDGLGFDLTPRALERLQNELGGLRAGDGVAAADHEERNALDAELVRLGLVFAHLVRVGVGRERRSDLVAIESGVGRRDAASASGSPIASPSVM